MTLLAVVLIAVLALVATLAAYMRRIYRNFGKILSRQEQEALDAWEELIEPGLRLERAHAALCAALLEQLALGLMAFLFGVLLFDRDSGRPLAGEAVQAVLGVLLAAVFCGQLFPALLFNRTSGRWVARIAWPIRLLVWSVTPVSFSLRFVLGIVSLAEKPEGDEEDSTADVEDLIEAGEEKGILERSDSALVRSAVEFGDKLVREVMTPRPQIFAVPGETTLEQFLELLKVHDYSRVPVYAGTIDQITGLAFAHDLLRISDVDAHTQTVASMQRPVEFVPETKRGYELLREMQHAKQHMRIAIDEYGGVAGVVTIEDLLEQIVGEIVDEHETEIAGEAPQQESSGAWLVPGGFQADQLEQLLGFPVEIDEEYEATTLGGLVSEIAGHIPLAGEVVQLENSGIKIEVVQSTDRKVERLRVFPPAKAD